MTAPIENAEKTGPSRLWILVGAGAFLIGLATFMMASASGNAPPSASPARADEFPVVEIETISLAPGNYAVRAPGRLQPLQTLQVVGEVPGKIAWLNPQLVVGGRLSEGDVLLRIDQGDYLAEVSRAEAQLATSEATLVRARADRDRQVELARTGVIPDSVRDNAVATFANAEAAVEQARAQLTLARRSLGKTTIRAPFDAIVAAEALSTDSFVSPGVPLAELMDASAGEIRAGLSPRDVAAVRRALQGSTEERPPVRAIPNEASLGILALEGYLDSFAPTIDPASRTVSVRAVFPNAFAPNTNGEVFAGDYMTLELTGLAGAPAYTVPTAALRRNQSIWLVTQAGRLEGAEVTPLENRGAVTLVTSAEDLSGKRVLVTPLAEEVAGMQVRVLPAGSGRTE